MARRATKDTYGVEPLSGSEEGIRRFVKAGTIVPDSYELESGSYEDVQDSGTMSQAFGHRTPPPDHLRESRTSSSGNTSLEDAPGMDPAPKSRTKESHKG